MKLAALLALAVQAGYVLSSPIDGDAMISKREDAPGAPNVFQERAKKCFYKKNPNAGDAICSKSGYCYGHCNLVGGREAGEWCWWQKDQGGGWVTCKTNAECSTWYVRPPGIGVYCGTCECE